MVPVAPEVGSLAWYRHQVPDTGGDLLVATRAEVGLSGLVGLDPADLEVFGRIDVHGELQGTGSPGAAISARVAVTGPR